MEKTNKLVSISVKESQKNELEKRATQEGKTISFLIRELLVKAKIIKL